MKNRQPFQRAYVTQFSVDQLEALRDGDFTIDIDDNETPNILLNTDVDEDACSIDAELLASSLARLLLLKEAK